MTVLSAAVLVVVAVAVAAFLYLLIRYIIKQRTANPHILPLQVSYSLGRPPLQQLFDLQDSGLDQACVDALPVVVYGDIMGSNQSSDCDVCLSEFSEHDRLRLLPSCSHAFHINCIDTWFLSNSTCPLCRRLVSSNGYSPENPFFYSGDFKDNVEDVCSGRTSGNLGFPDIMSNVLC